MDKYSYLSQANPEVFDAMYSDYKKDPNLVDDSWKRFFEGFELASKSFESGSQIPENFQKEFKVINLINAYRIRGHLFTKTNPVRDRRKYQPTLDIENFGLTENDLNVTFQAGEIVGIGPATLYEIIVHLKAIYCDSIGVEYMYIRNPEEVEWIKSKLHENDNHPKYSADRKKEIFENLSKAVILENFLHSKFVGQKRFSLEGVEALIPALDEVIETGAALGSEEFVFGMAHRGRLNVLINTFGKSPEDVFTEFEGKDYDDPFYEGDVKYHLGFSINKTTKSGRSVHLSLTPNPSHLEAVDPVVEGISRAKLDRNYQNDYSKLIPVLIHGDASIAGQGVVYEVVQMAQLDGYKTGGTIHIVLNNQVGFTTNYLDGRSSIYCTDVAKVTLCPVFHVNADDVEAVVHAVRIAMEYRQRFHKDVFIDILGYRKYGHNEGDEPRFTQPVLYNLIAKHANPKDIYVKKLLAEGSVDQNFMKQAEDAYKNKLQQALDFAKENKVSKIFTFNEGRWDKLREANASDFIESTFTGVKKEKLLTLASKINSLPEKTNFFKKIERLFQDRQEMIQKNALDWGMCELLAYASLLEEGHPVRMSGQDVERGTFSHRHAVVKVEDSEDEYVPLGNISEKQEKFDIYNSLLSEYAVLGFDYGYSLAVPEGLTIWEAQFGDFSNGAQIIIDQFIASAETKWKRMSGITLLLPHGYEGQGAEHSSARMERYLQLCAENNMQMVNCTTPANFFHVLRRQVKRDFRKPLFVFTPKKLLRYPSCVSTIDELSENTFQEVIDDVLDPKSVETIAFCSGKIYYELVEKRDELKLKNIAIVRIEQLYPLPQHQLNKIIEKYKKANQWYWVQEEPENMGAWTHILRLFRNVPLQYIGRKSSAVTATGSAVRHGLTQKMILEKLFEKAGVEA